MFTVCPKCSLKLVVTAADLRVAQGYVRCGRCSNVFNALIGLSDEQQAELARDAARPGARGAPQSAASESAAGERIEPYIDDVAEEGTAERADEPAEDPAAPVSDAALEFDPSQTDVSEVFVEIGVEESGSGSFESITLRTEEEPVAAPREPGVPPSPAAAASPLAQANPPAPSLDSKPATPRVETTSPVELHAARDARAARPDSRVPQHGDRTTGADRTKQSDRTKQPDRTAQADRSSASPHRGAPPSSNARASERHETGAIAPRSSSPQADAEVHEFELPDPAATERASLQAGAGSKAAAPKAPSTRPLKDAPEPTAKATPAAVPKAAPTAAPRSAPGSTPRPAAEATPKATPEADSPGAASTPKAPWGSPQSSPGARLAAMKAMRSGASSRVAVLRRPEPDTRDAAAIVQPAPGQTVEASVASAIGEALRAAPAPDAPAGTQPLYEQRLLRAAVAILGVLLAAQVVHHYRSALAEVDWIRPPLTAIYATLGMPLVPRWDVAAYEVHQLGAIAGAGQSGGLTVRASIKNTAAKPQPLPLLRVTLQDRFGNHVAARDVPPRAYLPARSAERGYLAPGQRVDAEVQLVDPGATAVGFEIDACLQDRTGRVSCANDASGADVEP
jgi:predicted Zn finger-like uncharacterized protein